MSTRKRIAITVAVAAAVYGGVGPWSTAYGTPATEAPWINRNGDEYDVETPRVQDLWPPVSPQEQRQVVEGAVQTVDNAAGKVTQTADKAAGAVVPPPPQNIAAAAGALLVKTVGAVAGAFGAAIGAIFK